MTYYIDQIAVEVIRKPVIRMHLRVKVGGQVVLSAPLLAPERRIRAFIEQEREWIILNHSKMANRQPKPLAAISREQAAELAAYLTENVERWRIRMGEGAVTWHIRNMKTLWGSCRVRKRSMTFNLQLARLDNELRDYIIVHELSHLQVPNHGPRFKARVSTFLPDWKEREKRLRQAAHR